MTYGHTMSVQGMNVWRSSVAFVTKTGVAHFTLQSWQLNKTYHFLCLFCNMFSEVAPKLLYTKCR